MEPETLTPRARDMMLLRMVPFVERNYNMVELGPRGTGKSHLFQQVSPCAHLISGGKATVARMFVNNANGQRALTGGLNLGGSIETIFNPVSVVETAIEKGAASILMPIGSRRQLNDLPDDLAAKITIH